MRLQEAVSRPKTPGRNSRLSNRRTRNHRSKNKRTKGSKARSRRSRPRVTPNRSPNTRWGRPRG